MQFYHNLLKPLRESAKMTQDELGKAIGVSFAAISAYERGKNNPLPKQVYALAKALGCSVYDISDLPPPPDDPALKMVEAICFPYKIIPWDLVKNHDPFFTKISELETDMEKTAAFDIDRDDLCCVEIDAGESSIYPAGALALFQPGGSPQEGKPCLAKLANGEMVCKLWHVGEDGIELRGACGKCHKWTKEEFAEKNPIRWSWPVVKVMLSF